MTSLLSPVLAQSHQPLFGNQWLALLAILAGVAVFMVALAGVGRWLAATHPESSSSSGRALERPPLATSSELTPQVCAAIAAAVATTFGSRARITAVQTANFPSVETLMVQWSLEGRRQIYSSHKVR